MSMAVPSSSSIDSTDASTTVSPVSCVASVTVASCTSVAPSCTDSLRSAPDTDADEPSEDTLVESPGAVNSEPAAIESIVATAVSETSTDRLNPETPDGASSSVMAASAVPSGATLSIEKSTPIG